MNAKKTNIIKKMVDACMTVLLLCLMAYQVTGETLHEWGGIAMTALLIIHHVLNFKWYKSLFRGKYNAYRIVTVVVNTLLLGSIALTALCGMAMSAHAVPFLYGMLPVSFARQTHLAMSFWSFLLMGVHLGLHILAMTAGLKWDGKIKTAVGAAFAVIAGVGFWLFVKNGIPNYIFFRAPFAFFDYEKAAALVFAENLAVLIAFAFLGTCAALLVKAGKNANKKKANKAVPAVLVFVSFLIAALLLFFTGEKQASDASWNDPAPQTEMNGEFEIIGRGINNEIILLLAVIESRTGRDWYGTLLTALSIAAEYSFIRVVSDEGAAALSLLRQAHPKLLNEKALPKKWLARVMEETERTAEFYPAYLNEGRLTKADFGKNALAVLRMQAQGASNEKIAEHLGVSVDNVKYHTKQNYKKLGVSTKTEMVLAAKELKLL